jgi:hypothetical protein
MVMGAGTTYISPPLVIFPPQVDANNFINSGTWSWSVHNTIFTASPYETAHTLNYTNNTGGSMTGGVGWEFDWGAAVGGPRRWSANFFNDNQAFITAVDHPLPNPISYPTLTPESYLLVSATNIVNKGTLAAGTAGEIILTGSNVNLTHSQIEIIPVTPIGSFNTANNGTNYSPDTGIYDQYWGSNNNYTITGSVLTGGDVNDFTLANVGNVGPPCGAPTNIYIPRENELLELLNPTNPPVPLHPTVSDSVSTNSGLLDVTATNFTQIGVNIYLKSTTTYHLATNQFRQAVFVRVATNTIKGDIRFVPSGNTTNLFETAAVQLSTVITNVITGYPETDYIYVVDTLAGGRRLAMLPNFNINPAADCSGATFRPTNFLVSRKDPGAFGAGFPGMGKPLDAFFYDPLSFSNAVSSGVSVAAYSALVDNLEAEVPAGSSVTNLPGRVRIYANNLNLNQTHVRAEGEILIKTTNLTSSANAIMDCQNLSYDLGTTNSSLNFTNLAPPLVRRLHGPIDMWSGYWTNYINVSIDNYVLVTNVTATTTNVAPNLVPLVNVLRINLAVFVVDAAGLTNTIPVTVQDLLLHNTNQIIVSDSVTVANTFLLDAPRVTLRGDVSLSGVLQNWTYANAPTLRYFTNDNFLSIPNNAHFGDDGPANYLAFVNPGTIFAGGQIINSVYLQIGGHNQSYWSGFYAVAQTAQLMNANITASSDIQFFANTLGITNSALSAGGALDFTVTNSLSDGGTGPSNLFTCQNGFNMWIPPTTGGLLNTMITDVVLGQDWVDHVWAGQDFGPMTNTVSANNAVIGSLILYADGSQAPGYEPVFAFYGATGNNAMYVNNLDLSELTDFANEIYIDPSLTIYFGNAKINPLIDLTGYSDMNDYLNQNSPFRYVPGGFTSSVIPPKESAYTRKFQLTANYNAAARQFQLGENIMPGQTNILQVSTDLVHWVPIFTNAGSYSNFGPATIADPVSQSYRSRFYRFRILP